MSILTASSLLSDLGIVYAFPSPFQLSNSHELDLCFYWT